jgi:14-3-3 protein epsilon
MQLLRDNLTLWTSSDSGEPEAAAAEPAKETEKAAEPEKTEEPKSEAAPATES